MQVMVFDHIQDIADGKRTLMYEPHLQREVGELFGATKYCNLTVLVCEVTEVTKVHLLDDLQNEESVAELSRTREELLQRWAVAHPNTPSEGNPLVYRFRFKWTGRTETRQFAPPKLDQSIVEEEDARCFAVLDAAAEAISQEIDAEVFVPKEEEKT